MVATQLLVDLRAVAGCGHVGLGLGQAGEEMRARAQSAWSPKSCCGELQHARGVGDDLHGLDAGDVVEEPAAAGVHELGVALHLHQLEGA